MVFMGQEAGETTQFHIDWWDDRLPLNEYEDNAGRRKIRAWYQALNDIRSNDSQTLATADSFVTHIHNDNGIAAFTRANGKYLVVLNFKSETWFNYDVGVSGNYLELLNTSWPEYNISGTAVASRGGNHASTISNVHIPAYGAVVLMRQSPTASVNFSCANGDTVWGQNVYVTGNLAELGNWNTAEAVKLEPQSYPTWSAEIDDLPVNTTIEWKCIKRDVGDVIWENGANNIVTTSASGTVSSAGSF